MVSAAEQFQILINGDRIREEKYQRMIDANSRLNDLRAARDKIEWQIVEALSDCAIARTAYSTRTDENETTNPSILGNSNNGNSSAA